MSTKSNVDNTSRRTWDKDEYAQKAEERIKKEEEEEEEQEAAAEADDEQETTVGMDSTILEHAHFEDSTEFSKQNITIDDLESSLQVTNNSSELEEDDDEDEDEEVETSVDDVGPRSAAFTQWLQDQVNNYTQEASP
mmetsp:Transcript_9254/g.10693  ORF Transcript_9254/g.10693 Transcript_9254/m.10693 type:complete len:137 (+) Transcript_9254:258-668(+)